MPIAFRIRDGRKLLPKRRQPEPDNRCLKQKGLTVNEQIAGPSVNPSAGSFIQDLMPLLTNYDSNENEHQYRSVLVRREACDADPALLGTKATITRRASSGRGRSLGA